MRIMRLLVMFDLPTKTKADKDNYIKFKRFLDDDGYQREQNSVYSRNLLSRDIFFPPMDVPAPQSRAHPSPILQIYQYPRSRHIPSPGSISSHGQGPFLQCEVVESYKRYSKKGLMQWFRK